jgi:hypothetical protein
MSSLTVTRSGRVSVPQDICVKEIPVGDGVYEIQFDEQRGLDQPGSMTMTDEEIERKELREQGYQLYKKYLAPAKWKARKPRGTSNEYVFVAPNTKKGMEGKTQFTGYVAIRKAYHENREDFLKYIRSAPSSPSTGTAPANQSFNANARTDEDLDAESSQLADSIETQDSSSTNTRSAPSCPSTNTAATSQSLNDYFNATTEEDLDAESSQPADRIETQDSSGIRKKREREHDVDNSNSDKDKVVPRPRPRTTHRSGKKSRTSAKPRHAAAAEDPINAMEAVKPEAVPSNVAVSMTRGSILQRLEAIEKGFSGTTQIGLAIERVSKLEKEILGESKTGQSLIHRIAVLESNVGL